MNADFKINGRAIETERLLLRPFQPSDLEDLYEYAKENDVGEMAGWKHHENIEESKNILDMFISEDKTFAICLKDNNHVIGSFGIEKYSHEDEFTEFNGYIGRELGFVLSKKYWGKGLMPEAINAVINFFFIDLNYDFLICGHNESNTQSKRVQEKCGFKAYRKLASKNTFWKNPNLILNLLINPNKNIQLEFSHPETLIFDKN